MVEFGRNHDALIKKSVSVETSRLLSVAKCCEISNDGSVSGGQVVNIEVNDPNLKWRKYIPIPQYNFADGLLPINLPFSTKEFSRKFYLDENIYLLYSL